MNLSNQKFRWSPSLKIPSMNDWLDIMLEEIDRKKREAAEAKTESARRSSGDEKSQRQADNKTET